MSDLKLVVLLSDPNCVLCTVPSRIPLGVIWGQAVFLYFLCEVEALQQELTAVVVHLCVVWCLGVWEVIPVFRLSMSIWYICLPDWLLLSQPQPFFNPVSHFNLRCSADESYTAHVI